MKSRCCGAATWISLHGMCGPCPLEWVEIVGFVVIPSDGVDGVDQDASSRLLAPSTSVFD